MNENNKHVVCRKHWTYYIIPIFFIILIGYAGFNLVSTGNPKEAASIFAISAVLLLCCIISYFTNYIELKDNRIVAHKGFIRSIRMSAPVSKIQNVSVSNGFMGKLFRYHTIVIDNAGTGIKEFIFPCATHALDLENAINNTY